MEEDLSMQGHGWDRKDHDKLEDVGLGLPGSTERGLTVGEQGSRGDV